MASEQDSDLILGLKWTLLIINAVSALYILVIFFNYLAQRNLNSGFSPVFVCSCIIGFVVSFLGADAAWTADQQLLIIYGIALIINLVLASFGGNLIFAVNLGLYVLCIVLAFVYAYFIRHPGDLKISPGF